MTEREQKELIGDLFLERTRIKKELVLVRHGLGSMQNSLGPRRTPE